jgi:hypothetical protein
MSGIGEEIGALAADAVPGVLEAKVGLGTAKALVIGIAVFVIGCALVWVGWKLFFAEHAAERKTQQVQTQAAIGKGEAGAASGHDAIQITVDNSKAAAGIDAAVREALHAISQTKGADQKLDPALDAAGRNAICMRPSAIGLPDCQHLQHASP